MNLCIVRKIVTAGADGDTTSFRPVRFDDLVTGSQGIFFDGIEVVRKQQGQGARLHAYEFVLADGTSRWIGRHEEINHLGPHGVGVIRSSWDRKAYSLNVNVGGLVLLHLNEVAYG